MYRNGSDLICIKRDLSLDGVWWGRGVGGVVWAIMTRWYKLKKLKSFNEQKYSENQLK